MVETGGDTGAESQVKRDPLKILKGRGISGATIPPQKGGQRPTKLHVCDAAVSPLFAKGEQIKLSSSLWVMSVLETEA